MMSDDLISPQAHEQQVIYQVSQLNQCARLLLEDHFAMVWVEGEISGLSRHASGHWFFSLKDAESQISCVMFRMQNTRVKFNADNGMHVVACGKVSLYTVSGRYQLIIESLQESGDGKLQRAFEQLKQRLNAEGLFDESHKQVLPKFPNTIGVITSPTGAAIRDILSTLSRRFSSIKVIIYPCEVQGKAAAGKIVKALQTANERKDCDVLIVARGGGSLEDLWPFNEEIVARAIFASEIPVVSGVGHEVDITIADYVADVRAATPTAAADMASPLATEYLTQVETIVNRLQRAISRFFTALNTEVSHLTKRLRHPGQHLQEKQQTHDYTQQRLLQSMQKILINKQHQLEKLHTTHQQYHPKQRVSHLQEKIEAYSKRLLQVMPQALQQHYERLQHLQRTLIAVSPDATLKRGYAIVLNQQQQVVDNAEQVTVGELVDIQLYSGSIACEVTDKSNES